MIGLLLINMNDIIILKKDGAKGLCKLPIKILQHFALKHNTHIIPPPLKKEKLTNTKHYTTDLYQTHKQEQQTSILLTVKYLFLYYTKDENITQI